MFLEVGERPGLFTEVGDDVECPLCLEELYPVVGLGHPVEDTFGDIRDFGFAVDVSAPTLVRSNGNSASDAYYALPVNGWMSEFDLTATIANWEEQISELEQKKQRIEEGQDSMTKGDWGPVKRRAEPEIERKRIQRCIDEIEECSSNDDLFEVLGEWRAKIEEQDIVTADSGGEAYRISIIRPRLSQCVEDIRDALPDNAFPECSRCRTREMPTLDKRYSEGYRWECPEC